MKIDLKRTIQHPEIAQPTTEPTDHYPSTYLSLEDPSLKDLEDGDLVVLKGVVRSVGTNKRDGKTTFNIEVDLTNLESDKTKRAKSNSAENEEEIENALRIAENNDRNSSDSDGDSE